MLLFLYQTARGRSPVICSLQIRKLRLPEIPVHRARKSELGTESKLREPTTSPLPPAGWPEPWGSQEEPNLQNSKPTEFVLRKLGPSSPLADAHHPCCPDCFIPQTKATSSSFWSDGQQVPKKQGQGKRETQEEFFIVHWRNSPVCGFKVQHTECGTKKRRNWGWGPLEVQSCKQTKK